MARAVKLSPFEWQRVNDGLPVAVGHGWLQTFAGKGACVRFSSGDDGIEGSFHWTREERLRVGAMLLAGIFTPAEIDARLAERAG